MPANGPYFSKSLKSSALIETTMPELAKGLFRLEGLQPFTTISPGAVMAGAIIPPGHIQKLNTPRPFTCSTKL